MSEEAIDKYCDEIDDILVEASEYFYNGRKDSISEKLSQYQNLHDRLRDAQERLRDVINRCHLEDTSKGERYLNYD